jgi:hypothetical protein
VVGFGSGHYHGSFFSMQVQVCADPLLILFFSSDNRSTVCVEKSYTMLLSTSKVSQSALLLYIYPFQLPGIHNHNKK